jgi:hypothetical protein
MPNPADELKKSIGSVKVVARYLICTVSRDQMTIDDMKTGKNIVLTGTPKVMEG